MRPLIHFHIEFWVLTRLLMATLLKQGHTSTFKPYFFGIIFPVWWNKLLIREFYFPRVSLLVCCWWPTHKEAHLSNFSISYQEKPAGIPHWSFEKQHSFVCRFSLGFLWNQRCVVLWKDAHQIHCSIHSRLKVHLGQTGSWRNLFK